MHMCLHHSIAHENRPLLTFRCRSFARHCHAESCLLLPATLATGQNAHARVHRHYVCLRQPAPARKLGWRQNLLLCLHPLVIFGSTQVGESRRRCSPHPRWRNVVRRAPGTAPPRMKRMTTLSSPALLCPAALSYEPGMEKVRLRFVSSRVRANACLGQEPIYQQ